jgi:hypothetical protein
VVESGNIVKQVSELDVVTSILSAIGYDAIGVGQNDLRICGDRLFDAAARHKLTVIDSRPNANKAASSYTIKELDGVKVAIFSFGGSDDIGGSDYEARKIAYAAYKAARETSDLLIVLDQANVVNKDWLERMGTRLGAPDIVIGGLARSGMGKEEIIGNTHIMPTSMQGKFVGVVDVELTAGEEPKFYAQLIPLDPNIQEDGAIDKLVKEYLQKQQNINMQPAPAVTYYDPNSPNKPYYHPMACRTCHLKQYEDWKGTKHAKAIQTLVSNNRTIPECLACHSEQFRRVQRVDIPKDGLGGVECASCHMQSLPHGFERRNVAAKTKVDPQTCLVCHTKDRSPAYDEKSYFTKVSHKAVEQAAVSDHQPVPNSTR